MSVWTEWPVDGWAEKVWYRNDVLLQIFGQMTAGFHISSWGGVEVGGILLGHREGNEFVITDHRPVDCEHANGPSYELTARDCDDMRKAIEAARAEGLIPIGWYKSVSNRELAISDSDFTVWAELLPDGVLLILKRSKEGVNNGITFLRNDGKILSGRRKLDAQEIALAPSEPEPPPELPVPKPTAAPVALSPEPEIPNEPKTLEPEPSPEIPKSIIPQVLTQPPRSPVPEPLITAEPTTSEPTTSEQSTTAELPITPQPATTPQESAHPAQELDREEPIQLTLAPLLEATLPVNAFALTPDPEYFFPSAGHLEALASLEYGIKNRKGFVMLIGDSGMGKTMVLECLSDRLKEAGIEYGFLFNSRVTRYELFELLAIDFDLKPASTSKTAVLMSLNDHLLDRAEIGKTTALLIDDAQKLSAEVLEEIELLSNLETRKGKLLQVVLAARPDFEARMNQPEMAGLRQRFVLRPRLNPLTAVETAAYIRTRLQRAGAPDAAWQLPIDEIHHLSGGVPRLINAICGQLLERHGLTGDTHAVLAEVADELGLIA